MFAQGLNWELGKYILLKEPRPGVFKDLASLGPEVRPGIVDVKLFVVFHVKHW
jgi:hypothetical protein